MLLLLLTPTCRHADTLTLLSSQCSLGQVGWVARVQRYLLLGVPTAQTRVPHIVFLDAGLAANFDARSESCLSRAAFFVSG